MTLSLRQLACTMALLLLPAAQAQEPKRPIVRIHVHTKAGKPMGNLPILLTPLPTGEAKIFRTDANGLAVPDLPEGRYTVTVQAPGFVSHTEAVAVVGIPTNLDIVIPPPPPERTGQVVLPDTLITTTPPSAAPPATSTPPKAAAKPSPAAAIATSPAQSDTILPTRGIPIGLAPNMQARLIKRTADEQTWVIVFHKGDEALSGLTDFAIKNHIVDAHFTGIGAASAATLGWLDLDRKLYRAIPVTAQCEVLSMIGDIATFNDRPVVHTHVVLGHPDGTTTGGHVWELHIDPTLEVFLTANTTPLKKRPDEASGMKLIDPLQEWR
jgi:predicted DNA-binding protein with PD1-like motif